MFLRFRLSFAPFGHLSHPLLCLCSACVVVQTIDQIKVSHAHAGMGKIRIHTPETFNDLSTVISLHQDYCTAETYIPTEYGIRVQKVGDSYRVLKKVMTGSGWKSQFGGGDLQHIALTEKYK